MPGAPAETPYRYFSLLGMVSSGDLGEITCYRSHLGKIVVFSKTWPVKLPTLAQLSGRARMYFGAEQWRNFSDYQQHRWTQTVDESHLCMTGYNLWMKWWMNPDYDEYFTIMNQTGISTLLCITRTPPAIPPPSKFQPHKLVETRFGGHLRYGRKRIVMPYATTEYLPFMCYHPGFADGSEVPSWWTLYGPGTINHPKVYNNQWCALTYESPAYSALATVELHSEWYDGEDDYCRVDIHTRLF